MLRALVLTLTLCAGPLAADSVAEIRTELAALSAELTQLRAAVQGSPGATSGRLPTLGAPAVRLDLLEAEMRALTGALEQLGNDVDRMANDGAARIAALEFRLIELEGGDPSDLRAPEPLGGLDGRPRIRPRPAAPASLGDVPAPGAPSAPPAAAAPLPSPVPAPVPAPGPALALAEQADFDMAEAALTAGDYTTAADKFRSFTETYPGGPLSDDAVFFLGEALAGLGQWNQAARSYLNAFSTAPDGERAPDALLRLGISLGKLGQLDQACLTLDEVGRRYPGALPRLGDAVGQEKRALACP